MQFDASKPTKDADAVLVELYDLLRARNAPRPGSFSSLGADGRREYFRLAKRRSRETDAAATAAGAIKPSRANVRAALADAALMLLAVDGPGADEVRQVLAAVFAGRPGVPMSVEQMARSGKLRPKLAGRNVEAS